MNSNEKWLRAWRHKWLLLEDDIPQTLVETLDFSIPEFNPTIAVAVKRLLTYPVSTCAAERNFSSMKRLKTPLWSAMWLSDARLSSLSVIHIHKHKKIDLNEVIHFCLCCKERQTVSFVFVTVNRYIPYALTTAKVSMVILIYSASVFLLLTM